MRELGSKFFLIFALATLTACSNGNSLSAQCESAISARDNFSAEVSRLWEIQNSETRAFNEPIYAKYSECLEDPDTFIRTNLTPNGFKFASCERWKNFNDREPRTTNEIYDNLTKMYMIISNNQSCFTPEEVVEAQLQLKG
jgi:hypothetical protein